MLLFVTFALGIVGWIIAAVLRAALVRRAQPAASPRPVESVLFGAVDEPVRFVVVLVTLLWLLSDGVGWFGRAAFTDLDWWAAIGLALGWTVAETFPVVLISGAAARDDSQGAALRTQLAATGVRGTGDIVGNGIAALARNTGLTLLLVALPVSIVVIVPLRAAITLRVTHHTLGGSPRARLITAGTGGGLLAAGVLLALLS